MATAFAICASLPPCRKTSAAARHGGRTRLSPPDSRPPAPEMEGAARPDPPKPRRTYSAFTSSRRGDDAVHTGVALAHAQPGEYFADELPRLWSARASYCRRIFLGGPADEAAFRHLRRVVWERSASFMAISRSFTCAYDASAVIPDSAAVISMMHSPKGMAGVLRLKQHILYGIKQHMIHSLQGLSPTARIMPGMDSIRSITSGSIGASHSMTMTAVPPREFRVT